MNRLYTKLIFGLLLLAAGFTASGQVQVTATAGTLGPTSYTTLKGAFDAINAGTHKGAITVRITGNTTESAKDSLGPSSGAASYTSVLVKPATGVTATIASAATFSTPLIDLAGASNVTIDGSNTVNGTTKDLTISNNDTLSNTIRFSNGASNNIIRNCSIKGAPQTTGVIWFGGAGAAGNNNNRIENNDISNSQVAKLPIVCIYSTGTVNLPNTGNIYRGNRVFNFSTYGIMEGNGTVGYTSGSVIDSNEVYQVVASTGTVIGIRINHPTGISNVTISRNNIHDLNNTMAAGSTSLFVMGIDLYDAVSATVVNNFIRLSNSGATSLRGIAQETAGNPIRIYYNTILLSGSTSNNGSSFAYLKNYTSTTDDVRNNMFINTRVSSGTGRQYALLNTSGGATNVAIGTNYNNLVSTGNSNNYVASVSNSGSGTDYLTLANWQATGADPNSISVNPTFVSATDLHVQPIAANSALDNKGVAIASVTTDIDVQTRSTTTPDMGADEFTAAAACTPPSVTLTQVDQAGCPGANASFLANVTGTAPLTYQWKKQGVGPIAGATTNGLDLPSITAANAGYYYLVVYNACGIDSSALGSLTVFPRPVSNFSNSVPGCAPATVTFTGTSTISSGTISSYFYQFGDGHTAQVQNPSNTYATAGTYNVQLISTSSFNCSDTITRVVSIGCTTAVSNLQAGISEANLLPTAVRDNATIRVSANRSMTISWTLVDGNGRILRRFTQAVANGNGSLRISLNGIPPGAYQLLGYSDKGKATTIRFVKL
ncbi:PKD domain-containing protein [Flaviaesturariibacter terrae]